MENNTLSSNEFSQQPRVTNSIETSAHINQEKAHSNRPSGFYLYVALGMVVFVALGALLFWFITSQRVTPNTNDPVPSQQSQITAIPTQAMNETSKGGIELEDFKGWKTYSNSEFGFSVQYPPEFERWGKLTLARYKGETGELICISFKQQSLRFVPQAFAGGAGCAATNLNIGLLSADYQAGREYAFSDTLGYEVSGNAVYYKMGSKRLEVPIRSTSIFTNPHGVEILKIVHINGENSEGLGSPVTVTEGTVGAIINTHNKNYPAITLQFNKAAAPDLQEEVFEQILSTFQLISPTPKQSGAAVIEKKVTSQNEEGAKLEQIKYTLTGTWKATLNPDSLFLSPSSGGYLSIKVFDLPEGVGRREFFCTVTIDICQPQSQFTPYQLGNISGYMATVLDNSGGGAMYFGAKGNKFYLISTFGPPPPNEYMESYTAVLDSLIF